MRGPTFRDKLAVGGPKKLLALDGGGIRGRIAIEFLARIESELRVALGRADFVLADYFDYVGGTSTGAIIGALVALGMPVAQIREFYVTRAKAMFARASVLQRFRSKYASGEFAKALREVFGDATLGSDRLRTLLLLVMRNASTDSPWPLSSNPNAAFNEPSRPDCNLRLPLWQLVRASAAAPVYFPPEVIDVGEQRFIFVDGAVTMYNNPAFLLFMMATLEPYRLQWPVGEAKLLLVSVGTGLSRRVDANLRTGHMHILYNAGSIPSALIYSALVEQDKLCRVFGRTRAGARIDSEIGDLSAVAELLSPKLFTYARYNIALSRSELDRLGFRDIPEEELRALDRADRVEELGQLGAAAAESLVNIRHFDGFL